MKKFKENIYKNTEKLSNTKGEKETTIRSGTDGSLFTKA